MKCNFCENPNAIISPETCCSGCDVLIEKYSSVLACMESNRGLRELQKLYNKYNKRKSDHIQQLDHYPHPQPITDDLETPPKHRLDLKFDNEMVKECSCCDRKVKILCDGDVMCCEYEKDIFVECECGEIVGFIVPVN